MLHDIKGAIFDLDGTLVDSMWVWEQIDIDYLKEKGYLMPGDLKNEILHLSFSQTALYFKNRFQIEDSLDDILNTWHNMAFNHYSNDVKLKKGAKKFLQLLKKSGIKIGLATSNSTPLLKACLENNEIFHYFDAITTTDETSQGKDQPDVYLLAAKKLGVEPNKCIVFEDILPAIQGAKSAGMKVVAVKDNLSIHSEEELTKYADKYINSFLELI
ncbi:HAD family hydrolase [Clostridium uliginosum]|uniref:Haloacid dehalogenase superfamily, subfamily IA, variant 3 with third motif having DD or ED/haloacid dehalogenase superfamily, subfamily IA, variant 1 with third motif having Dx(3-4)D or Dx(3-4)E n=1 Tax=Clostridium uliginosum TaxID=119641 RepID=A0A1I1SA40_9CLOT|nr:HAD family phosphatase [Clostridium uliginosum]SFD43192.1 haloacid dehalogenase superfamily, subfamily IA, variant 3 with third motif having DD or ED/haloacid dehalogenase superfamily, subfamily IA, variant 1 with third motif having Dx(3-4)D or Dx(3-4)E [Clostridium uliginosum]